MTSRGLGSELPRSGAIRRLPWRLPGRTVLGVDLAGSPARPTGLCLWSDGDPPRTRVVRSDAELLVGVVDARPDVVSVDAPLGLPRGRASLEVPGPPHLRRCDRALLAMGIRFFPVTLGPMRLLTARGIGLARALRARGLTVIEGYPGGAQDLLGLPRKGRDPQPLRSALLRVGVRGDVARASISHDELDAVTCAIIGRAFLAGDFLAFGDPAEGLMVLPGRARALARLSGPPRGPAPPAGLTPRRRGAGRGTRRRGSRP